MHDQAGNAVLDEEALAELREDLEDAFAPFVARFLDTARDAVQRMGRAAGAAEWSTVAETAHGLKGSAGYLGARELEAALRELQRAAEDGEGARTGAALERAAAALQRVAPRLEAHAGS